jgi:hypothetical protein
VEKTAMTEPKVKSPAEIEDEQRHRPQTVSDPPQDPEDIEEQARESGDPSGPAEGPTP